MRFMTNYGTARLCSSFLCLLRAPQEVPTASASSPFIYILSNFLSSVLVLITIIASQWVLTTTAKAGEYRQESSCHRPKISEVATVKYCVNNSRNPQVCSGEPQTSRWFFCQTAFFPPPRGCLSSPIIYIQLDAQYRITVQICLLES